MKKLVLIFSALTLISIGVFGQGAVKKVVIEEFTGAWCGWCPDGAVILEYILDKYPDNTIGISLHNGDAMVTAVGNQVLNFYTTGYPSGVVDRAQAQNGALSRSSWESNTVSRMNGFVNASISMENVSFDDVQNVLSVDARITFLENMTGKFRPNLLIVEDEVTGSGSGYNQSNYTNTTQGHPYFGAGNPIVGFKHGHVLRAIAGPSAWGLNGQISDNPTQGTEVVVPFQIYINPIWDKSKIHIVTTVNRFDGSSAGQREILNGEEMAWSIALGQEDELTESARIFETYPNPFGERLTVAFELAQTSNLDLSIYNATGQKIKNIAKGYMNTGMHSMFWGGTDESGVEVANGTYFAVMTLDNGEKFSRKIVLYR